MGVINPAATTELEAVNQMLSVIGEAPVASLASTQADVVMALDILEAVTREVSAMPWRFNTEYAYELTAAGTVTEGGTARNYYTIPGDLAAWSLSRTAEQGLFDVHIRMSRVGTITPAVLIFADRLNSRDGIDTSNNDDKLYIDPVWFVPFEEMPQAARRYISIAAARRFQRASVGSPTLEQFSETDEITSYLALKRDEGIKQDYNLFANADTLRILGGRPSGPYGVIDIRDSRRG